jgi:phenylalanyl-tRNA synthetase beta chain
MQFSEHWLRTMVNPELTSDALSHLLTMAGLEVEEVEPVAPPFTQVVVAQVMSMERHPNADRLNVCQVDAGTGTPPQVWAGGSAAQSSLLQSFDAGLGIRPEHAHTRDFLDAMLQYMPPKHRALRAPKVYVF